MGLEAINGDAELSVWQSWVTSRLSGELAGLTGKSEADQLAFLDSSLKFFGFHTQPADGYGARYIQLNQTINAWFAAHATVPPLATTAVRDKWRNNYVIQMIGGAHPSMIGAPSSALSGLRPIEYALLQWQPK
jgi:hypothetical protein